LGPRQRPHCRLGRLQVYSPRLCRGYLQHRRILAVEPLVVTAELEDIADKLERLNAGLAVEQAMAALTSAPGV